MKDLLKLTAAAALLTATISAPAHSAEADFTLHNDSTGTIVSFRLANSDGWGPEWLDEPLRPQYELGMDFANDGECVLDTRVEFADGTYLDAAIDYCSVNNVYIEEDEITID